MGHGAPDLAVAAFADPHGQPCVRTLLAVQIDLHRLEFLAVDGDTPAQRRECQIIGLTIHAHAIAAQPARGRQLKPALELAVIGQKQQPLGIQVKPPDGHHPRQIARQRIEHRLPPLFIRGRGDQPDRLVIEPEPRLLWRLQRLAIDAHLVRRRDVQRGAVDFLAVHGDPPFDDHALGLAPAGDTGARHDFGNTLGAARKGGFWGVGHRDLLRISAVAKRVSYTNHAAKERARWGLCPRPVPGLPRDISA